MKFSQQESTWKFRGTWFGFCRHVNRVGEAFRDGPDIEMHLTRLASGTTTLLETKHDTTQHRQDKRETHIQTEIETYRQINTQRTKCNYKNNMHIFYNTFYNLFRLSSELRTARPKD